jgi:hypothetical protein
MGLAGARKAALAARALARTRFGAWTGLGTGEEGMRRRSTRREESLRESASLTGGAAPNRRPRQPSLDRDPVRARPVRVSDIGGSFAPDRCFAGAGTPGPGQAGVAR